MGYRSDVALSMKKEETENFLKAAQEDKDVFDFFSWARRYWLSSPKVFSMLG